jgi:hypothetical protein
MPRPARLFALFAALLVAPILPFSTPARAATTTFTGTLAPSGSQSHSFQSGVGAISAKVACTGKARLSVALRNPSSTVLAQQGISCTSGGTVSANATTSGAFSIQLVETARRSTSYTVTVTTPDGTGTTTTTAPASTVAVIAKSDTYVSKNSPGTTFGGDAEVRVDNGDVSPGDAALSGYIAFDLSGQAGRTISSGKMRLYVSNPSADRQNVRVVDQTSWPEAMTYDTRPAMGSLITTTPGSNVTGWLDVDVTSYVHSKAGQQVSFGFDQSGIDGFAFHSREAVNKPQLVLTMSESTTSTTTSSTTTSSTTTSSTTATTVPPTSTPALWRATHDAGNLNEWSLNGGGGLYSSGSYEQVASTDQRRSGTHSLRARIWTPGSPTPGVRAFRWAEARGNRALYFSAWLYVPTNYALTGDPCCGRFWNVFQFKSTSADGSRNDPVWAFYATPDGNGGLYLRAGWGWGGTTLAGPYAGDGVSGKNYEPLVKMPIPVGRWFQVQGYLNQSKDFDGRVVLWQDGTKLYDFANVRTSYNNCKWNAWCSDNGWSVNLYSDGLSPNPATMYIDDATISTSYVL